MSKEKSIQVIKSDPKISTNDVLRKIYQALDPNGKNGVVEAVEFPHGVGSNQIKVKLGLEANSNVIRSQLEKIEGIALKK